MVLFCDFLLWPAQRLATNAIRVQSIWYQFCNFFLLLWQLIQLFHLAQKSSKSNTTHLQDFIWQKRNPIFIFVASFFSTVNMYIEAPFCPSQKFKPASNAGMCSCTAKRWKVAAAFLTTPTTVATTVTWIYEDVATFVFCNAINIDTAPNRFTAPTCNVRFWQMRIAMQWIHHFVNLFC